MFGGLRPVSGRFGGIESCHNSHAKFSIAIGRHIAVQTMCTICVAFVTSYVAMYLFDAGLWTEDGKRNVVLDTATLNAPCKSKGQDLRWSTQHKNSFCTSLGF